MGIAGARNQFGIPLLTFWRTLRYPLLAVQWDYRAYSRKERRPRAQWGGVTGA